MSQFVETWKCIASTMERSERWCRYMARRAVDPLPVFKMGGVVRLNADDLQRWLVRQRDCGIRPASLQFDVQAANPDIAHIAAAV